MSRRRFSHYSRRPAFSPQVLRLAAAGTAAEQNYSGGGSGGWRLAQGWLSRAGATHREKSAPAGHRAVGLQVLRPTGRLSGQGLSGLVSQRAWGKTTKHTVSATEDSARHSQQTQQASHPYGLRVQRGPPLPLNSYSLAGPKNERSGPEKGRRAARPVSGLWGRDSGQAGLLTRAFSRQRSASLRSLRAAADAPIVSPPTPAGGGRRRV
jgi:hypothetical protein